LTLQQETTTAAAATAAQQQRRFDRLRGEFNAVRPHEALGQRPAARVYVASPRPYPARLRGSVVRRDAPGPPSPGFRQIKWRGTLVFVSEAVRGEMVGLVETERGDWTVRFMHVELGRIHRRTGRFQPAWHGPRIG